MIFVRRPFQALISSELQQNSEEAAKKRYIHLEDLEGLDVHKMALSLSKLPKMKKTLCFLKLLKLKKAKYPHFSQLFTFCTNIDQLSTQTNSTQPNWVKVDNDYWSGSPTTPPPPGTFRAVPDGLGQRNLGCNLIRP